MNRNKYNASKSTQNVIANIASDGCYAPYYKAIATYFKAVCPKSDVLSRGSGGLSIKYSVIYQLINQPINLCNWIAVWIMNCRDCKRCIVTINSKSKQFFWS